MTPTDPALFFSRDEANDPRLGDLAKKTVATPEVVIVGYPDDEGICRNGGREGARAGPRQIRHWLYRTTPHPRRTIKTFTDLGDLKLDGTIGERHSRAELVISNALESGARILSLGGGNDYAYPDGAAFLKKFAQNNPIVINIDAHLDVRDMSQGPHSGTPFFRLLESEVPFEFIEVGSQAQCNARAHWDYVERKGGRIISLEEILGEGVPLVDQVIRALGPSLLKRRPTFLAVDIDAFAWPYAIGSSAAWPVGLDPQSFWPLLHMVLHRLDVRVFGIYEVAPPLDVADGTSKLAAQIAHSFLHHV